MVIKYIEAKNQVQLLERHPAQELYLWRGYQVCKKEESYRLVIFLLRLIRLIEDSPQSLQNHRETLEKRLVTLRQNAPQKKATLQERKNKVDELLREHGYFEGDAPNWKKLASDVKKLSKELKGISKVTYSNLQTKLKNFAEAENDKAELEKKADEEQAKKAKGEKQFREFRARQKELEESQKSQKKRDQTVYCYNKLKERLDAKEQLGFAIDDGDCFFDAFSAALYEATGIYKTISELRKDVETVVKALPESDNWVLDIFKQNRKKISDFQHYKMDVGMTKEELERDEFRRGAPPVWGQTKLEGNILCEIYHVQLQQVGVNSPESDFEGMSFDEDELVGPADAPTIKIGLYPGHFVPILRTE
ncbi:MAG: hypothetical protein KDK65_02950 [Chlamydiia bacterium]|nr:hypothetical protein [Chlamydiia bacterium]